MTGRLDRLARLIRDWWRIDRVRISPREGRLLRLQSGDLLQLLNMTVMIVERRVEPDARGVRYRCEGGGCTGELRVTLDAGRQADEALWTGKACSQRLSVDEIEVYPAARRAGRVRR